VFRGQHGYLALELWGKDKDLSGYVRPQFFTRSGEEIELPSGFADAVKAVTSGVTCLNCSHPHYSKLVVPPPSPDERTEAYSGEDDIRSGDHQRLVEAEAMVVADGVSASRAVFIRPTVSDGRTGGES
jgi:hypothetical protein